MPEPSSRRRDLALDRFAAAVAAAKAEGTRPPRAGDLFALPATSPWPVEWAVVGPAPGEPGRLLAVPADTHPLAGSGDLTVPEDAPAGPLTLRCRFATPLSPEDLPPERRSGLLDATIAERLAAKCGELRAGLMVTTFDEEEVDSSPEYQHWISEVIEPAFAAVTARSAAPSAVPPRGEVVVLPSPPRRAVRSAPMRSTRLVGLAASALLVISLTLGGGLLLQSLRLERTAAEHAVTTARLRSELQTLNEARRRELLAHRAMVERLEQERRAAPPAAEGSTPVQPVGAPAQPLVNLPFVWLRPETDTTRGETSAVALAPTADLVALILPIDDPGPFTRFRLEVIADKGGRRVWRTEELVRTGLAETSLALPRSLLTPGAYTLRLSGLGEGGPRPLATYRLRVVR